MDYMTRKTIGKAQRRRVYPLLTLLRILAGCLFIGAGVIMLDPIGNRGAIAGCAMVLLGVTVWTVKGKVKR